MRVWWSFGGMVALWLLALAVVWSGVVFFVGLPLGMGVSALAWIGLLFLVVVLGVLSRRRWLLVLGVVVTLVLVAATYNWAAAAPRSWFDVHRPLFDRAVRTTDTDDSYYGARLPFALRPLSSDGRVAVLDGGVLFFPQWIGIPDDAGGYLWSPDGTPQGADMFGDVCIAPVDLGDGWWICRMTRDGEA